MKAFVDGITAAVVGALAGAVAIIGMRTVIDLPTFLITACTIISLIFFNKIKEPVIILFAALIGLLIKHSF